MTPTTTPELSRIVDAIRAGRKFLISSHVRPDGDAVGSSLAMAYALRALGKEARVVFKDPAPEQLQAFPGVKEIELAGRVDGPADAAIIMECGNLARTGVAGFEQSMVINIDHHPGNDNFGQINWFDDSAAACGEMVYELIVALGVPLSLEIATHLYITILTDTGSFHYSSISARTFAICRAAVEAGVDPVRISRQVYDSSRIARLKLLGSMLSGMTVDPSGQIAVLYLDDDMLRQAGGTYDDTEGLINEPLTRQRDSGGDFLQANVRRRIPCQSQIEGRGEHRRRGEVVRRRWPQKRRRLYGSRRSRRAEGALHRPRAECHVNGWLAHRRQAHRTYITRRRGTRAACAW